MIHECQTIIESDNLLMAGMKLRDLELEGLFLKTSQLPFIHKKGL
jgi:hypothetical protein